MSLFSRVIRLTATTAPKILKTTNIFAANSVRAFSVPRVQNEAPDFKGTAVVDQDFKEIKLADYKGKYLVFYFYPLDFTFVCPTEIIAFSELYDEFKKINTEIVACSTDSHFSHLAWKNTSRKAGGIGDIKYPLLSDFTKQIAKSYNVLIESSGVALRGLYIIDGKGIIRHMSVNDLPVGRSVEEVLRLVKAFQFNDKHGEGIQFSLRNLLLIGEIENTLKQPQSGTPSLNEPKPEKPSLIDPKPGKPSLIDPKPEKPSLVDSEAEKSSLNSKKKIMSKVKEIITRDKSPSKK